MCGIAGFVIAEGDYGKIDTEMMTAVLAYEMQSRGKDATGILTVDPKGRWKLRKKPYAADVFVAGRQGIGVSAQTALIHTRAATQGKPSNPLNNHPIQHGGIIGIHNGIVWNDDALFKHYGWPRLAEVDSEAIFAALNYLPRDEALTRIDGGWAIAWIDTDNDARQLWLARGSSSPLHYATTLRGSLVFASTSYAVKQAFEYGGISGKVEPTSAPEGFLASVDPDGKLTEYPKFDGSGKDAPGARTTKVTTYGGPYQAGMSWNEQEEWEYASTRFGMGSTKPAERVQVTGDPKDPKVGDIRKYADGKTEWVYEACTSSHNPIIWTKMHDSRVSDAKRIETKNVPIDQSVIDVFEIDPDNPFETESDPEVVYGFAGIGDVICIDKKLFTFNNPSGGHIVGEITGFDAGTQELIVNWRTGRLDRYADYKVLIKAQEGG